MKLGLIGLGNMGAGIASNLLGYCQAHNHKLIVLDIDPTRVEQFVDRGAIAGESAGKLARQVQVLFTSLPGATEIAQLAGGKEGILQNLPSGAVWFETSTNDLAQWETLNKQAPAHLTLVDAPVTGGAEGAAAGTLTMLLGIDQAVLKAHAPLLSAFTKKAVRMGPSGAGYVAKLCQLHLNYLVAQGIGEALMLGAKAHLDLDVLHHILQNSCAQSYVVDNYIPQVLDGSYDRSFTLGLARKDLRLITELGTYLNVELNLAERVYATYQTATAQYGDNAPHLSVIKLIEEKSGRLLRS